MQTSDRGLVTFSGEAGLPAYSEAWWVNLTANDLHRFVMLGFAAGAIFYTAVAESRRREKETAKLAQVQAVDEALARRAMKRLSVSRLVSAVSVIVFLTALVILTLI